MYVFTQIQHIPKDRVDRCDSELGLERPWIVNLRPLVCFLKYEHEKRHEFSETKFRAPINWSCPYVYTCVCIHYLFVWYYVTSNMIGIVVTVVVFFTQEQVTQDLHHPGAATWLPGYRRIHTHRNRIHYLFVRQYLQSCDINDYITSIIIQHPYLYNIHNYEIPIIIQYP